jgi:hypothetical protein
MGTTPGFPITWAATLVIVLMMPMPARAFDLSGGLSLGGFQAGTVPRLAISPHAGIAWKRMGNLLFTIHDLCSILPPSDHVEMGVYSESSIAVGYATETACYSVGPSLAFYSMMACGLHLCGRVVGVAAGGHAQTDVYFAGPLGVSVSANVNWIGGQSLVLPGGLAFMVVAGPVLRWRIK